MIEKQEMGLKAPRDQARQSIEKFDFEKQTKTSKDGLFSVDPAGKVTQVFNKSDWMKKKS